MLSSSPIQRRQVSLSLSKLKKVASDNRFRIKSLRMKTIQSAVLPKKQQMQFAGFSASQSVAHSGNVVQKNYERQLGKRGFSSDWLYNLYLIKSQQMKLKTSEIKYKAFAKGFYHKLIYTKTFNLAGFNLGKQGSKVLLDKFVKWNKQFIAVDLSQCSFLSHSDIVGLVKHDQRMLKLRLNNMSLDHEGISEILKTVIETGTTYELDLSNINSHNMNRFGQNFYMLQEFASRNSSVGILKLDNINLHKIGLQTLAKGISQNLKRNHIRVLNISNNCIGQGSHQIVTLLARSGITHLDLSQNPLTPQFFHALPSWKSITLKSINLTHTDMDSQAFCVFLTKVEQNKNLQSLKADRNDLSHHWFSQVKNLFQVNSSIQNLSLVDCNIKYLSTIFEGLHYNRYMKRVNISYNDGFEEDDTLFKRIPECIQVNKNLQELKMRFCGLKPKHFIKIFAAIVYSKNLRMLDISENNLSDEGAKSILMAINSTMVLENVIMQKVQISMRIKKDIDDRMRENKQIREKEHFWRMKEQNLRIRQKDEYTWQQLQQFEKQVQLNDKVINDLQHKVDNANKVIEKRRQKLDRYTKQKKQQQKALDSRLKLLQRRKNKEVAVASEIIKEIDRKHQQTKQLCDIQHNLINTLEDKIRKENQKIRQRENQLEDNYKNKKYLTSKSKTEKTPFDNTASVIKKKKSLKPK